MKIGEIDEDLMCNRMFNGLMNVFRLTISIFLCKFWFKSCDFSVNAAMCFGTCFFFRRMISMVVAQVAQFSGFVFLFCSVGFARGFSGF